MADSRPASGFSLNQTCELCRTNIPTTYCTCTGGKVFLCDLCFVPHRKKNPNLLHMVVAAEEDLNLVAYQQRCASFAAGKKELLGNLDRIDHCCEEVTATVEELVQKLYAYRDSAVQQLQAWKGALSAELYQAVQEVEAALLRENVQLQGQYANALRNFQEGNLELFRYRVDASEVETAIQRMLTTEYPQPKQSELSAAFEVEQPVEAAVDPPQAASSERSVPSAELSPMPQRGRPPRSPLVYVMSDSFRLFNLETCRWGPAIKLNSPITIDSRYSYTLLDEGRIFCCGAESSKNEAVSGHADRAYVISTDHCSVEELPRMNRLRCGSGVISVKASMLVFAGYCRRKGKNENHKTGETISIAAARTWTFLPGQMKQKRCWFTPFEYEQKVYLCGGHCKGMEVFDLEAHCFQSTPVKLPESTGSMMSWVEEGRVTIISHNFTTTLDLSTHSQTEVYEHNYMILSLSGNPVVSANFLFWTCLDRCYRTRIGQHPTVLEYFKANNAAQD